MSWAAVVSNRKPPLHKHHGTALEKPMDRVNVQPHLIDQFNEVERRTQVLRKVPPSTTTVSILNDLKVQCEGPLSDVVDAVVQEPLDRRRFYIRYKTVELKRASARRGFKIGNITIPPERADVQGYIPDVPHYMSEEDVIGILSRYGEVINGRFATYEDTGIRCGGFNFELDLHSYQRLPRTLQVLNDTLTLKLRNDIMTCMYCDKVGHIQRHCRKKLADQMAKADLELQQQQQQLTVDDFMDDEPPFQHHQAENNSSIPHEVINPPAPMLTPIPHNPGTPLTTSPSEAFHVAPGQGTPASQHTEPPKGSANPINPVYQSKIDMDFSITYEAMEAKLKQLIQVEFTNSKMKHFPTIETLTEEQYATVKDSAWTQVINKLKMNYDRHGIYTPFMEERERRLRAINENNTKS